MEFELRPHTQLLTIAGSRAYGIHKPDSDVDVKGVAIPPARYYLGFLRKFEQADKPEHLKKFMDLIPQDLLAVIASSKLEGSIYEISKFFTLASDCNPNILDIIFCRDEEVLLQTPTGKIIRDNRDLFLSAKAKHTFSGYAMAQLKRIRHHRSWLLNPPQKKPERADFGLPERTLIPPEQLNAIQASVRKVLDHWDLNFITLPLSEKTALEESVQGYLVEFCSNLPEGLISDEDRVAGAKWLSAARHVGVDDNLILVMQKEREYDGAFRYWKQYQTWKAERNSDRAAGEAQFGYDVKHGGHLVRLLRMGREVLETGKVHVWRGPGAGSPNDAEELRSIRKGAWSYEKLIEWAEGEDKALQETYNKKKYVVPHSPDREALDDLCVKLIGVSLSSL